MCVYTCTRVHVYTWCSNGVAWDWGGGLSAEVVYNSLFLFRTPHTRHMHTHTHTSLPLFLFVSSLVSLISFHLCPLKVIIVRAPTHTRDTVYSFPLSLFLFSRLSQLVSPASARGPPGTTPTAAPPFCPTCFVWVWVVFLQYLCPGGRQRGYGDRPARGRSVATTREIGVIKSA